MLSAELLTTENLVAFLTLSALEIVLGIDNIVFIAILTSRLPLADQSRTRRLGLLMAMGMRIMLLFVIGWVVGLKEPLFAVFAHEISGRDLIMLGGGLFLMAKSTFEIHGTIEGGHEAAASAKKATTNIGAVLLQICLIDIVFSLDSVITAVGMVNNIPIMIASVVASVGVMMVFANPVSAFIMRHPTVKMLALSFLMLIGFVLLADGLGHHIEKAYIYFAMGFSVMVEALNLRFRRKNQG